MGLARWNIQRLVLTLVCCALAWLLVAWVCICMGSTGSFGWPKNAEQFALRRDLVLTASLVGASLAAAGVAYQAILRNPLADPYLLGTSSGASLAAYLWRLPMLTGILTLHTGETGQAISQQTTAFIGAGVAVSVVFFLAGRRGRLEPLTLLLVGVIVNAVCGSIFLFLNELFKNIPQANSMQFLVGGIQTNLTAAQIWSAMIICAIGWIVLMYIAGQLNVANLGDAEALSLGVQIHHIRWAALVTASLMTAAAVAVSGPIGFVGLVCPHLARLVVGKDQRILLPAATSLGAILLVVADAISRKLSGGSLGISLPVGVLTGLLGGPFFLLLLFQSRGNKAVS